MRFDDQSVDTSQLEDRRGVGTGGRIALGGGATGIVGVIIYLLVTFLGGGGTGEGLPGAGPGAGGSEAGASAAADLAARCNTSGAIDQYDDCFVLKVFNEVNEVWTADFQRGGQDYTLPTLVYFEEGVSTGCGQASSQVGPFYCPPDQKVYIDLGFLRELQNQFGAQGRYAQAYIVAHEVGHHIQTITGTEARMRQGQQADPSRENELSVQLELQADCYAGVWSTLANKAGNVSVSQADLDEALRAAQAVGDDRIQASAGARVDPETWTHGSAEQRKAAFLTGYQGATQASCGTVPH
ncbi:neutral zinc metallopeptidase [Frankia sp. CNm7]|uniref:Neutral zinc metallopeptidase n=1 Tax=Frankia nepalensis TaxID=1836974 RepID=A0A937UT44_9ACTN|nr:neutral zinc metallopeptidase [Frankia nepalensis]MBL7498528.1 neutral zinc metallopeptidase [Frankia nepalensis]MBL7513991.1 neutral zinc metallopeptidase [Frankia nepalensis]MBL7522496.1 neutral zinc metallopeptidase [Frankia nepalensis]MBL7630885.1 neutral zinc metallopeptidase [Frankia nepalensis]